MNDARWLLALTIITTGAVLHLISAQRPGRLLMVALGRPATQKEHGLARAVRGLNLVVTAAAVILVFALPGETGPLFVASLLPLLPIAVYLVAASRLVAQAKSQPESRFIVPLTGPPPLSSLISPGLQLLNLGALTAATAWVLARADGLPDRLPMHWNARGEVDGWGQPLDLLFLAYLVLGLTVLMGLVLWASSRVRFVTVPNASERHLALMFEQRRMMVRVVELVMISVHASMLVTMVLMAYFAGEPGGYGVGIAFPSLFVSSAGVLFALAVYAPKLAEVAEELERLGQSEALGTRRDGWRGGVFYFAPDDPAVFVPKRAGFGMTLNFARPGAWLFLVGTVLLPGLLVVGWVWLRRLG